MYKHIMEEKIDILGLGSKTRAKINSKRLRIAPPGFEPRSKDPKSSMIGHYTTGLYLLEQSSVL